MAAKATVAPCWEIQRSIHLLSNTARLALDCPRPGSQRSGSGGRLRALRLGKRPRRPSVWPGGRALAAGVSLLTATAWGQPSFFFTDFAGLPGGPGQVDGLGAAARFRNPAGVATDTVGNVYVADSGNRTIRVVTPAGQVTTLAGSAGTAGSADGSGTAAEFMYPMGVAVDGAGNVYVADQSAIRQITPAGVVTTLAGCPSHCGFADGTGGSARFNQPRGVAVDSSGNVYVADSFNNIIREVTPDGVVTTLAGDGSATNEYGSVVSGYVDATGPNARFNTPCGLTVDTNGNVYVADSGNAVIRMVTPNGVVSTVAGTPGAGTNTNAPALFYSPVGVAVDGAGNLYVADQSGNTISEVTPDGSVTLVAGIPGEQGSADGGPGVAAFANPWGVAVDGAGNVYVGDYGNNTLRTVSPDGVVTTLAGTTPNPGSVDGTGSAARFNYPNSVTVDGAGNLYVADSHNYVIRKITPDGVASTFAGSVGNGGTNDGPGGDARFEWPASVAVDTNGNIYVADPGNDEIRKITSDGMVTTLAGLRQVDQYGNLVGGSADGTGSQAQFRFPQGVAVDSAGFIYVADTYNFTIRKITPDGVVTTLAGTALQGGGADGTGPAAQFNQPTGLAVDGAGNIYVADWSTIRKVTPDGVVTTLAGTPTTYGYADGVGGQALFAFPNGVACDPAGNIYVADSGNDVIRLVTPAGVVSTVGGVAGLVGSADGLGSAAQFSGPGGIALDSAGNLDVADTVNNRISQGVPGSFGPLAVGQVVRLEGALSLTWQATPGRRYRLQYKTDLTNPGWVGQGPPIGATSASASTAAPFGREPARFYTVVAMP